MKTAFQGLIGGLVLGVIAGTVIFFVSSMPLTPRIIYAEAVTGAITGVLMALVVRERKGWPATMLAGGVLGCLIALPVALDAKMVPYIPEAGAVEGLLLAAVLKNLNRGHAGAATQSGQSS